MKKETAREFSKDAVKNLNLKDKFRFSAEISKNALNFVLDKKPKTAFVYMSVSGEPSTFALIQTLQNNGIIVYTPKIADDIMLLTRLDFDSTFELNKYGIPELQTEGEEKFDCDINIIPLVSYDKNLNRVGRGKGYYDKYLSNASGYVCALAFSCCECDEDIECDGYDVKPDCIITEKGIIYK